jgi:hypothetical protein
MVPGLDECLVEGVWLKGMTMMLWQLLTWYVSNNMYVDSLYELLCELQKGVSGVVEIAFMQARAISQ